MCVKDALIEAQEAKKNTNMFCVHFANNDASIDECIACSS